MRKIVLFKHFCTNVAIKEDGLYSHYKNRYNYDRDYINDLVIAIEKIIIITLMA